MGDGHDHPPGNPVNSTVSAIETGHTILETAHDADKLGKAWGDAVGAYGAESAELAEGAGTLGSTAMAGLSAVMSPLSVYNGLVEIIEGADEGGGQGALSVVKGTTSLAGGAAGFGALAGSGFAAAAGPVLASFGGGITLGQHFDHALKDEGWFTDTAGRPLSASEMAADRGDSVRESVTAATGYETLGSIAGGATVLGESVVGAGAGAAAAAVRGGRALAAPLDFHAMCGQLTERGVAAEQLPWFCKEHP